MNSCTCSCFFVVERNRSRAFGMSVTHVEQKLLDLWRQFTWLFIFLREQILEGWIFLPLCNCSLYIPFILLGALDLPLILIITPPLCWTSLVVLLINILTDNVIWNRLMLYFLIRLCRRRKERWPLFTSVCSSSIWITFWWRAGFPKLFSAFPYSSSK
jgi:hypothetical protein